jgi:catalase
MIYDLLPKPQFDMAEVEQRAETAHEWYKEKKFRPSAGAKLSGYQPSLEVYGV